MSVYRYRINRSDRLLAVALSRLLRARRFHFEGYPPMAAIVGDYIGDEIRAHGRYEDRYLRLLAGEVFPRMKPGVALDIGANIGNHSLFLSRHFDRVIAFEPNPATRRLLTANLAINEIENVSVESIGLSDRTRSATLIVKAGNLGASHVKDARAGSGTWRNLGEVAIEMAAGDQRLDPSADIRFIKLDVEGLEHEVLRGLLETIRRCRPVIMLEQLSEAIDGEAGTSLSHDLLASLGYEAFEIQSVPPIRRNILRHLVELLAGRIAQRLVKLERLERRHYPALIFLPA